MSNESGRKLVAVVRTPNLRATFLAATTAAAALLAAGGCNTGENPPFDPRAIQRPEREAATQVPPQPMRPLPTTLESQFLPSGPGGAARMTPKRPATDPTTGPAVENDRIVRMPLQEVVHRAVANNLDVKVAGYGPAIESTRVVEAEARFDPAFFSNVQWEHRNSEVVIPTGTSSAGRDRANIVTGQTGIRQILESGGQVELRYQTSFTDVNAGAFSQINPNPFVENQLILQIQQPLLQNFGTEVNTARITIGRNNQRISLLDFRKQLEETTRDVERTYWQLAQAERDMKIAERLLQVTLDTAEILVKRLGQDVTRVQVSQANASVERRRAVLIRAKSRVREVSDQLKRLIQDPEMPVASGELLMPAEPPMEQAIHFKLEDEIASAMLNRFELGQQQLRIDSAAVAAKVAQNNTLPQLNLVGQVGVQGLDEDFTQALEDQFSDGNTPFQVGLQFEIPIGNRQARAVLQRARLQQLQAIDQYRNLCDQISLEVKTALREVETTWAEIGATRQARFAAADSLNAIEQRERGGEPLTPTFVQLKLTQQEQLAEAATAESAALSNYNIAITQLELAKGTLLRYNNVVMQEAEQLATSW